MGAALTRGTTFSTGGTVSATNLHAHIEGATIANIDRTNIDRTNLASVTKSSAAPSSPTEKEVWQDSTTFIPIARDTSTGRWKSVLPNCRNVQLSADSAAVAGGNLLKFTATDVVALADGGSGGAVHCVAAHAMSPGDYGVVVMYGNCKILTTGTINAGEAVRLSATSGVAESAGAAGVGYGPNVFAKVLQAASGGSAWVIKK